MTKVQLTLTSQEVDLLSSKAAHLGYNLVRYLKFLISKAVVEAVEEKGAPVFKMSRQAEKATQEAVLEYKKGKSKKIKSVEDLDKIV